MAEYRKLKAYWSLATQERFLSRFTELVEHGFSISEALEVMSVLFHPDKIQMMINSCQKGLPFADALQTSGFEARTIYIIQCNEQSGSLLQGLQKARNYSQHYLKNQKDFKKKLRYPLFIFSMMLVVLVTIYLFFIPQIDAFYGSFNIEGDQTALEMIFFIIGISLGLILTFATLTLTILKLDHPPFQFKVKQWLFQWFGVRQLSQKVYSYYFSSQWLMLLECGLPLKESLSTIKSFEKIPLIRLIVAEFEARFESGESLESVINTSPYFTPYYKLIMTHALRIGSLNSELQHFTTSELESLSNLITTFFKVFQTSLLILIGCVIVLLYLSILQPVFEMVQLL